MRRSPGLVALLAIVVADAAASAQTRPAAARHTPAAAPSSPHRPHAGNTSNTAFRNQMKKFSDPLGANGR